MRPRLMVHSPQQALSGRAGVGEDGSSDVERSKRAGNGRVEGEAGSEVLKKASSIVTEKVTSRPARLHDPHPDARPTRPERRPAAPGAS